MIESQRRTMLVVDDVEMNRAILHELFGTEYEITEAVDGVEALAHIRAAQTPFSVVLMDLVMPRLSGMETLTEMARLGLLERQPVIVVTSSGEADSETAVLNLGAQDIIQKPFVSDIVRRRVRNVVDATQSKLNLERIAADLADRLQRSNENMVNTLSGIIEHRSVESGQHILRIRRFTRVLLEEVAKSYRDYDLSPQNIRLIARASTLHDIGKIVIPDAILNKPGRLTAEEFTVMKTHATEGSRIVLEFDAFQQRDYLNFAYQIARHHHERYDGRGYPDGLAGDLIPLCAQVVGVADVYDALTTPRVYKPAYPHEQALGMILEGECGLFSDRLMACFQRVSEGFRQLATDYRDGALQPEADREPLSSSSSLFNDALGYDLQLYHTSLRFLNGVAVELDFDKNTYHVAYPTESFMHGLPRDGHAPDLAELLIVRYVHPDDQEAVRTRLRNYYDEVLLGYMAKSAAPCRILVDSHSGYQWFNLRLHRIDTHNLLQHRALMLIENVHEKISAQIELQHALGTNAAQRAADLRRDPDAVIREQMIPMHHAYGDLLFELDPEAKQMHFSWPQQQDDRTYKQAPLESAWRYCETNIHPDVQAAFRRQLTDALAGIERPGIRVRRKNPEGGYDWTERRCYLVRDEDGRLEHIIGMIWKVGAEDEA